MTGKKRMLTRAQSFKIANCLRAEKDVLDGKTVSDVTRHVKKRTGITCSTSSVKAICSDAEIELKFKARTRALPSEGGHSEDRIVVVAYALNALADWAESLDMGEPLPEPLRRRLVQVRRRQPADLLSLIKDELEDDDDDEGDDEGNGVMA